MLTFAEKLSLRNSADANGRNESITGCMPFFFRLSTPKTILMILTSEGSTGFEHCALHAHRPRHCFTSFASLWPFSDWGKEDFCKSATLRDVHPFIIGLHSLSSELK
jgi:hypothetical protein